jgi:phosphatidylserine decarboxylase
MGKAVRMWLLYHTWIGHLLLLLPPTWWLLTWQHHRIARYADSPRSKKSIKPFTQVRLCKQQP